MAYYISNIIIEIYTLPPSVSQNNPLFIDDAITTQFHSLYLLGSYRKKNHVEMTHFQCEKYLILFFYDLLNQEKYLGLTTWRVWSRVPFPISAPQISKLPPNTTRPQKQVPQKVAKVSNQSYKPILRTQTSTHFFTFVRKIFFFHYYQYYSKQKSKYKKNTQNKTKNL